jgi:septal ring factor EnvC (AmiA/AmiB activator)
MVAARSGQIDEISQTLGRLEGKVDSLDQYTHEREHSIANLSGKVDGVSAQITREVARMKAELQVQLDAMNLRIATLEGTERDRKTERNIALWFLQSPLIGWIAAAALFVAGWWKGLPR